MQENRRILIIGQDPMGFDDFFSSLLREDDRTAGPGPEPAPCLAQDETRALELLNSGLLTRHPFALVYLDARSLPAKAPLKTAARILKADPSVKILMATHSDGQIPNDILSNDQGKNLVYLQEPFSRANLIQLARSLVNEWNLEKSKDLLAESLKMANKELGRMNQNLRQKVKKQAAMIVQAEKMASVGLLAAGVAHEINNPISYVSANLFTAKTYFTRIKGLCEKYTEAESFLKGLNNEEADKLLEDISAFKAKHKIGMILKDLETISGESIDGIERVKAIVSNLKTFSRIDKAQLQRIDINQAIETTLNIIWNELRYKAQVDKDFENLPPVRCFPQKISQVFMNLLINAAQAIEDKGRIYITTRMVNRESQDRDRFVQIRISDTGSGIPKTILDKIFDPFFTTKPVGQGTGLGLSIVYEIIKAHNGRIDVVSRPGKGTRFTLHLPVTGP